MVDERWSPARYVLTMVGLIIMLLGAAFLVGEWIGHRRVAGLFIALFVVTLLRDKRPVPRDERDHLSAQPATETHKGGPGV